MNTEPALLLVMSLPVVVQGPLPPPEAAPQERVPEPSVVRNLLPLPPWLGSRLVIRPVLVVVPVPPWATLSGVVRPVRLVMSLLAPLPAAPRAVRAPLAVVEPVPPFASGRVPVTSVAKLMAVPLLAAVSRPWASTVRLARV